MIRKDVSALRDQYVAAMTVEMKMPLQKIIQLTGSLQSTFDHHATTAEIEQTARHLLGLVQELQEFTRSSPENVTSPDLF